MAQQEPPPRVTNAARPQQHSPGVAQHEPQHEAAHDAPRARTRRRRSAMQAADDIYYIPPEEIPEGSSYEWKRFSVKGQEDPFYIAQMREQGWEPVDPRRHTKWLPPGYDKPNIIKGGLMLMERPMELTLDARKEQRELAVNQIVEAEERLGKTPENTLTRDHKDIKARVVKEVMRPLTVEE